MQQETLAVLTQRLEEGRFCDDSLRLVTLDPFTVIPLRPEFHRKELV